MPTKATVDVKEPRDVKRLAAAEGVATKDAGAPVEMAQTAGPKDLDKLPFFQMLGSMTERQWEDRMVYLYRQDKTIIKADEKDSNYIERISHAFDEAYVKEKHGGGRFLAILKNVRINGAERKHSFKVEGDPIIHDDEVSIKKTSDASGQKSETALLLEQVKDLTTRLLDASQKNNGAESAAISNAVAMLSEASRGALNIQQEAMKSQIGSSTGHPLVDKFLAASIEKLGAGDKGGSELEKMVAMLKIIRELQPEKSAGGAGLLGNIGEIKGVLEVLKDLGVKIGGGGEAVAEAGGMDWKAVLASTLPQALQVIGGYAERFMAINAEQTRILRDLENARRAAAGMPQLPPGPQQPPAVQQQPAAQTSAPAPVNPPAASPLPANFAAAAPAPAEVLPASTPAPAEKVIQFPAPGVDMDVAAQFIRRCFDAGDPGDAAALVLKRVFADDLAPFRPYLSQLKTLAAMSPLLKDIVDDADFPVFLEEFVEEMNRNEDAEPDGPEAAG